MHINGACVRIQAAIADSEARTNARLDAIECKLDAILQAAGIVPPEIVARVALPSPAESGPALSNES
jgi:hypothetical protein